jgi:hypothetical protein
VSEAEARPPASALPAGLRALRTLGESPTSEVTLVVDEGGRLFALKVLRASVATDPRVAERLRREAELLSELDHPNLVRCHGSFDVDGRPALLLEFVEGSTLREVLREGPLGWEQAARYGVQIARALARLHRHGAVHRDVKPHNVLLHPRRGAVLADLGLVRRGEDPTLTRHGAALGSPAYMSPEQARDPSDVDEQADVYSLGATLYHALAGHPPFLGAGVGEVIQRVMMEDPEPLPDSVPDALQRVLATALAKDRERRYARAEDLGADLGRVMLGYAPRLLTRSRRRARQRLTVAAGAVAALALGTWWWWPSSPEPLGQPSDDGTVVDADPDDAAPDPSRGASQPVEEDLFDPERGPRAFAAWNEAADLRLRQAIAAGRWQDARAELEVVRHARVPPDAPLGWRAAKLEWLTDRDETLRAEAERTCGQALEILDNEIVLAREAIRLGAFDATDWAATVEEQWRAAGLRLADLPLWPGGADPVGRLRMTRLALDREAAQERLRAALAGLPRLRASAAAYLLRGDFPSARRLWELAEPALLQHAREARYELARTDELLWLQRRLESRLRERFGQVVSLRLHDGRLLEGTVVLLPDASRHAVDYLGQSQVPVDLLLLDADFALAWLRGEDEPWLAAQLLWCQGRTDRAAARMETLSAAAYPEEWSPPFWTAEWREELLRGAADPAAAASADPVPPAPPPAADGLSPQSALVERLRARYPGAALTMQGEAVEISFTDLDLRAGWTLDLRSELRNVWRLDAWEIAWRLPAGAEPPRRVRWCDDVELLSANPGVPEVLLGTKRHPGFGVLPGVGEQTLAWKDGAAQLDGVAIGTLPASRRLAFSASSEDPFRLTHVRLRFLPR